MWVPCACVKRAADPGGLWLLDPDVCATITLCFFHPNCQSWNDPALCFPPFASFFFISQVSMRLRTLHAPPVRYPLGCTAKVHLVRSCPSGRRGGFSGNLPQSFQRGEYQGGLAAPSGAWGDSWFCARYPLGVREPMGCRDKAPPSPLPYCSGPNQREREQEGASV